MKRSIRSDFIFTKTHRNLRNVLADHELASLGDSFVNFIYSLALSNRAGIPSGKKVKGTLLAEALRRAGLRDYLPSGMTTHTLADAAEALIVYAWLHKYISLEEAVSILGANDDPVEGLSILLQKIRPRIRLS